MVQNITEHKGKGTGVAPCTGRSTSEALGTARVVKGSYRFTCTPTNGVNHTWLCLSNRSWFSFAAPPWRDKGLSWPKG